MLIRTGDGPARMPELLEGSVFHVLHAHGLGQGQGQLAGELRKQVRRHPDAVGAGQLHDPAERRNAAHPDDVGLDDVHGFRFDEVAEAVDGVDVLAQGDGHGRLLAQAAVRPEVVGAEGFLQPFQSVLPQNVQGTERMGEVPSLVGVDHEQPVRADHRADGGDALGVFRGARACPP